MDRDIHYKEFWQLIRSKVLTMRELDSTLELLPQAKVHRYYIAPVVSEKTILEFERKNKITLPPSYRSYLQYFGAQGASAYTRTIHFETEIFHKDVSGISDFVPFEGTREPTEEEISKGIRYEQGTVSIALGWNPIGPQLVLNGEASGYVFWDSCEYIGCEGEFWQWYSTWTDKALAAINQRLTLKNLPRGTDITDVEKLVAKENVSLGEWQNHKCAFIKHDVPSEEVLTIFTLDDNGLILEIF